MDGHKQVMERIGNDTLHFYANMLCSGVQALCSPLGELSPQVTERGLRLFA